MLEPVHDLSRQIVNRLLQIVEKIERLADNPASVPSVPLEGYPHLRRAKSGEYRIIYRIENGQLILLVLRIGKRHDGEVYKNLEELD